MSILKKLLAGALLLTLSSLGLADGWPDKPVHLVVPYPPGGNVDLAARIIADGLQKKFDEPFVVENRPGAGGMIAGAHVARADADGYTLFVAPNGPVLFSPLLFKRDTYNWKKDFAPIGSISFVPLVLQVNPKLDVKTAKGLFDYAKAHPGELVMASPGVGTQNHLISEMLQHELGAKWVTVQYKGNAPATTDLLGGHVDFNFDQLTVAKQYVKSGKLRPLAVTSMDRIPSLPDVPTLRELGYPKAVSETFTGLFAPAGTPDEIVNKLNGALKEILAEKDVIKKFDTAGADARAMSVADFKQFLADEYDRWSTLIKEENIHR